MTKPLIIYHGNCPDGFTAAWVAARALGDVELFAGKYGDEPPYELAKNRDVYIVDFSYPREKLEKMCESAQHVTLLDHHKSAEEDIKQLQLEIGRIRTIPLSGGKTAYVDEDDVEKVSKYSWSAQTRGGAIAYAGGGRENPTSVYMHRLIMEPPEGLLVDHWNRNSLDNRRCNLRLATRAQNAANMDRGSTWKGVRVSRDHWSAQITFQGQNHYLGVFDTAEEAARAYDSAARELFGEFALLNFDDRPKPAPVNLSIQFDMNRSGAGMAWDYFHPGGEPRPWIVDYVEDRDLWRFKLPASEEVSLYIRLTPHELEAYDALSQQSLSSIVQAADGAMKYLTHYVRDALRNAYDVPGFFGGSDETVRCVNVSYTGVSDVLHGALEAGGVRVALGWHLTRECRIACSLRSTKDVDCSVFAKMYGGGGHAQASGFNVDVNSALARRLLRQTSAPVRFA